MYWIGVFQASIATSTVLYLISGVFMHRCEWSTRLCVWCDCRNNINKVHAFKINSSIFCGYFLPNFAKLGEIIATVMIYILNYPLHAAIFNVLVFISSSKHVGLPPSASVNIKVCHVYSV